MNTPNDPKGAVGALKTPLGLIPSYAMAETAWVHKLGAEKYGPFNWRKTGVCASTYVNAIMRHLNAWRDGETLDPESGISHLAHVACSCNILLDAGFCGTLQDDRNITPPNTPARKMDKPMGAFVYPIAEPSECTEGFVKSEGDFGYVSTFKIPIEFADKAEAVNEITPIPFTEYRLLKVGEIVQEGDEYYYEFTGDWLPTGLYPTGKLEESYAVQKGDTKYRRKVQASNEPEECSCGRYKIRHFVLGLICEDCELKWQDPY
jgi:hypothetical protein